jgi:diadenosine tetraphosphate (Ap4A) HIT family hydrolase
VATNYVLVDFENIQPTNLAVLKPHSVKVFVLVGANQNRIPFELATAMQALGEAGQYIKINASGKNALDFHIAFYLGEFAAEDTKAHFHIISRDSGFDALIKHMKQRGIKVQRESDIGEIPFVRMSAGTSSEDMIDAIVKNLAGRGQARPRKVQTLSNTINSLFTEKLSEQKLSSIIKDLEKRNLIKINNGNVSYQLPQRHG